MTTLQATGTTIATARKSWTSWLAQAFGARHGGRLDPRALSDHLKRDMGFLDGVDPTRKRR